MNLTRTLLCLVLLACAREAVRSKGTASLEAAAQALSEAITREGIPALSRAFADDVSFLAPNAAVLQGAAAATDYLTQNAAAPAALRWDVIGSDVSGDSTHGYTWAQGVGTIGSDSGRAERPSYFLTAWRRDAMGSWKIASMVFTYGSKPRQPMRLALDTVSHQRARTAPNVDLAAHRAALLAVDAAFSQMSVREGGSVAFQYFATDAAAAVSDDSIITGRAAVGRAFTFPTGDTLRWTPRYADAAASGDLGFTIGDGIYYSAQAKRNFYSKYLTIWQMQQNGEWRWIADLGNSQPPPTGR